MDKGLAVSALKEAVSAHRAFTRWLAWCDGLHAAKVAAGVYDKSPDVDVIKSVEVEQAYSLVNERPPRPSKTRKYRMYADAYRAASAVGLEIAPGSIRDMAGIASVISQVTDVLASAR